MEVTEIALLPLKIGQNPHETNTHAGKNHTDSLETVLSQPGAQWIYWGRLVEDPSQLIWFVGWNEIEDHLQFTKSESYGPFMAQFGTILGDGAHAFHARFRPDAAIRALLGSSPATEIVTMWFPSDYSDEDQQTVVRNTNQFVSILGKGTEEFCAAASGWVDEELEIEGTSEKGRVFLLLVGWTSVQAHHDFCQTQMFKNNINLVMDVKDLRKITAVHSNLTAAARPGLSH